MPRLGLAIGAASGALGKFDAKVLQTSLSNEDEAKLQATFGAEEIEA